MTASDSPRVPCRAVPVPPFGVVPGPHRSSPPLFLRRSPPLATVTIYYENGTSKTIENVSDEQTIYYENLPFTNSDVTRVETKL